MAEDPEPEFRVEVTGTLEEGGLLTIEAKLAFPSGRDPERGSRLFTEATLALMEAIAEEGQRGRARGAKTVRLVLDVPGERTTLDLGTRFPDPGMLDD